MPEISTRSIDSPLGAITLAASRGALISLSFTHAPSPAAVNRSDAILDRAVTWLQAYFAGRVRSVEPLQLKPSGTDFQVRVWRLLRAIPFGGTRTYGDIAGQLDSSPRAVGGACRANPLPILVPCHRVVAADGLGGYAGQTSGSWFAIKAQLLRHERDHGRA